MSDYQPELRLLPRYFKIVAFIIMGLSILTPVMVPLSIFSIEKELLKLIVKDGIIISLLLLTITKGKVEDERSLHLRLRAYTAAFIFGAVIFIIEPLISGVIDSSSFISGKDTFQLLISMFFFYFIMFAIMKYQK